MLSKVLLNPVKPVLQVAQRFRGVKVGPEVPNHSKNQNKWMLLTFGVAMPVVAFIYKMAFEREEEIHAKFPNGPPQPDWDCSVVNKPFPWGDGQTPLFEHLFPNGKHHGEHHE